jgi:RHS repeat-associated protein
MLGVEALETRELLSGGTVLGQYSYSLGGQISVTATVTANDSNYEGLYLWQYHVQNVNFTNSDSTSGITQLQLGFMTTADVAIVTSPTNWTGAVMSGDGVDWQSNGTSGAAILPGQSADFAFTTLPGTLTTDYMNASGSSGSANNYVVGPDQINTTTTVATSPNPASYGQPVTFTATVSPNFPGSATPSGQVGFYNGNPNNGQELGTATLNVVNGVPTATFTTDDPLNIGNYNIYAAFSSDDENFADSTSTPLTQVVNRVATTTTLASFDNPAPFGGEIELQATVTTPYGTIPTGSVDFVDQTTHTDLGSDTIYGNGYAQIYTTLAAGTHQIVATYSSDANDLASSGTLSQVVNREATTTNLGSEGGQSYGDTITFTASVSPNNFGSTPTGNVDFFDQTTNTDLGSVSLDDGIASLSTASLTAVSHRIVATYGGDSNNVGSSSSLIQDVNPASTTVDLEPSEDPSTYGDTVTFTATVRANNGETTPAGTVDFVDQSTDTDLGSRALDSHGVTTLSTAALAGGDHDILATFSGTSNYQGNSTDRTQDVDQATATLTLASSGNPSTYGETVTFTATASAAHGSGVPTGTMDFTDETTGTDLGTISLNSDGMATLSIASLSVGSHEIGAYYDGDRNFQDGYTNTVTQVVDQEETTTTLASSENPSLLGNTVTFTATVAAAHGVPTGMVDFYDQTDGDEQVGTGTLNSSGVATMNTADLTLGEHTIVAVYTGDNNDADSTSNTLTQAVHQSTTTTLESSEDPSTYGDLVTFTATVSAEDGTPTGTVHFRDETTQTDLGTDTLNDGVATLSTSDLAVGRHSIVAIYCGDSDDAASRSDPLSQSVQQAPTTVTLESSDDPSTYGDPVTLTATVRADNDSGVPTATVDFYDQSTYLGSGALDDGVATLTLSDLVAGSHPIVATYNGDDNDAGSSSNTLTQIVDPAATTTTLTSSEDPSAFGDTVTFTATVAAANDMPTGSVDFRDQTTNTDLGSGTLNDGVATVSASDLTIGTHQILATYLGDGNHAESPSSELSQIVLQDTTTTLTSSEDPAAYGDSVTLTATVDAGSGVPTGTVDFRDLSTNTDLGSGTLNDGVATVSTSSLAAGDQVIRASYLGDANDYGSSAFLTESVVAPDLSVTANPILNASGDDPVQGYQLPLGEASVDLNNGGLRLSQALDFSQSDSGRASASYALVYNSATVNVMPRVSATVTEAATDPVPAEIEVQLTFDNVAQGWQTVDLPAGYQPGQALNLTLQVNDPVTASGFDSWSVDVQFVMPGGVTFEASTSGTMAVVTEDGSPYGAGWGLSGVDRLYVDSSNNDVLWVTGSGDSRVFTATRNGDGTYSYSNPDDFGTLVQNSNGTFTYTATNQTVEQFNADGLLTSVTNSDGLTWTYTYDGQDRLTQVTSIDGGITTLQYGDDGLLSSITEPGTRSLSFTHDGAGNLTQITDVDSTTRTFSYDDAHHLIEDQWAPWDSTFTYDANGYLNGVDLGGVEPYSIASVAGQIANGLSDPTTTPGTATVTDGLDDTTTYVLDSQGRLLSETDPGNLTQTWVYDGHGDMIQYTDARNFTTSYIYDSDGDLTQVNNPDGSIETYTYDSTFHQVLIATDGDDNVTVNTYNSTGDLTSTTTAAGTSAAAKTTYSWTNGLMTSMTDPDGNTTSYTYNSLRQLIGQETEDRGGNVLDNESFTYDANGFQSSQTIGVGGPSPQTSYTTYDGKGQLLSQTDADGNTTYTTYAAAGDVTSTTDGRGIKTQYLYNTADEETKEIDDENTSNPETTKETEDAAGNVTTTTDADGNETVNVYNADNRLIQTTTYDIYGVAVSTLSYTYDGNGNVLTTTDGDGNVTTDTYDSDNRVVTETVTDRNGKVISTVSYTYDADNNVLTSTDGNDNVTTYTYDSNANVLTEITTDRSGKIILSTTMTYDKDGNVLTSKDGDGNTTYYTYDGEGRVVSTLVMDANNQHVISTSGATYNLDGENTTSTDGDGNVTYYTYDGDGNVLTETIKDLRGNVISTMSYTYDQDGNVLTSTDGDGNVTSYTYNGDGNVLTEIVKDRNGNVVSSLTYTYDLDGNVLTTTDGDGNVVYDTYDGNQLISEVFKDGAGRVISSELDSYDLAGNTVTTTDGDGNVTTNTYDGDQLIKSVVTDPKGNIISSMAYTYDENGNVLTTTDGDGNVTTNTYDGDQLVSTVVRDSSGNLISSVAYGYDEDGNTVTTTDGDGNVTTNTYDDDQLIKSVVTDPRGNTISSMSYTYDDNGNVLTTTDGNGNITTNTYDGNQLVSSVIRNAAGILISSTAYGYDQDGNTVTTTDGDGNITTNTYDGDQLIKTVVTDPSGKVISTMAYTYDENGNIATTTDGDGTVTTNTWDGDQLVQTVIRAPDGTFVSSVSYTYDEDGNTLTTTDDLGNVTTNTWDGNQLVKTVVTDVHGTVVSSTSFAYDKDGNQTSTTDADSRTIASVYDGNQLVQQTWYNPGGSVANVLNWSYDADGNVLSAGNNAGTYAMTYDGNQLITQTTPSGLTLTYGYDQDGDVTSIADSQGGLTTMTYNALGQVVTKTYQDATTQLRADYTYDQDGNVLTEARYSNLAGTQLVARTQYGYDGNELTSIVTTDSAGNTIASYNYTYDTAGWLISETDNGVTTNYAYDPHGQLIQAGSTTYSWDANGNPSGPGDVIGPNNELLSDGTWNYSYDAVGNLIKKVSIADGTTWTYGYNNANQMVSAAETDAGGNMLVQVSCAYDVFGNRISETVTQNGTTTTTKSVYLSDGTLYANLDGSGSIQTCYVSDVQGPDHWLARVDSSGGAWLLSDHLGSVRVVLGLTGGVLDQIDYDAFGNIANETDQSQGGQLKFQGGEYDAVTGNYHFGARDYNPEMMRWNRPDPMGFAAGDSNLYRFVDNAPTNAVDPQGTELFVLGKSAAEWTENRLQKVANSAKATRFNDQNSDFLPSGGSSNDSLWYMNVSKLDAAKLNELFPNTKDGFDQLLYQAAGSWTIHRVVYFDRKEDTYRIITVNASDLLANAQRKETADRKIILGYDYQQIIANKGIRGDFQTPMSMDRLGDALADIAVSEKGKEEARRIGTAIDHTFAFNWRPNASWLRRLLGISDELCKGYYCYDWAYAFEDAFKLESSGKFFSAKVEEAKTGDGPVHYWLRIDSLETKKSVFVDDGFMSGSHPGNVHETRPQGGRYQFFNGLELIKSQAAQMTIYGTQKTIYPDELRSDAPYHGRYTKKWGPSVK